MKNIINSVDKERVARRNKLIFGLFLIFIMLFSTIGFAFSFRTTGNVVEDLEYNGVEFLRDQSTGYWTFDLNGNQYFAVYSPQELENISLANTKTINDYANKPVYFVGEAGDGFAEIYRVLTNYVSRVGGACLDQNCSEDYPLKDCSTDNVIIIEEILRAGNLTGEEAEGIENKSFEEAEDIVSSDTAGSIEGVTIDRNCVYVKAKPENLVRYADAYMYDLLGI